MEVKQSTSFYVPVVLTDPMTGIGLQGVASGSVVVTIQKQAGSATTKLLNPADWVEISPTGMAGVYDMKLLSSETDTVGFLKYGVSGSGMNPFVGTVEIVANVESDTYTRIGAPSSGSVSADIAAVRADSSTIVTILEGRWKIDTGANTYTLYANDGTTVIKVFDLKDASGNPTSTGIFERVPR